MQSIRSVVVDDEPLARRRIMRLLKPHAAIQVVAECGDGPTAATTIERLQPDLVFLDIQLPQLDGFGVLEQLPADRWPVTIFVTAFDEHAVRAFENLALDYLLKPVREERFAKAVKRAEAYIQLRRTGQISQDLTALLDEIRNPPRYQRLLMVRESGLIIPVSVDSIEWIEAAGQYVRLHAGEKTYLLRERMHVLEAKLDPDQFFRIHRSIIVRIDQIRQIEPAFHGDQIVHLRSRVTLTMSRNYRAGLDRFVGAGK